MFHVEYLKSNVIKSDDEYFDIEGPPPPSYLMYKDICLAQIWYKMKEKYGLQSEAWGLAARGFNDYILECNIPTQIRRGFMTTISVKIGGGENPPFLDLQIMDPDNNQLQCPDPSIWHYDPDTGKFNLEFTIPLESKLGKYNAIILLDRDIKFKPYGDIKIELKDVPEKKRRQINDFQEKIFEVIA